MNCLSRRSTDSRPGTIMSNVARPFEPICVTSLFGRLLCQKTLKLSHWADIWVKGMGSSVGRGRMKNKCPDCGAWDGAWGRPGSLSKSRYLLHIHLHITLTLCNYCLDYNHEVDVLCLGHGSPREQRRAEERASGRTFKWPGYWPLRLSCDHIFIGNVLSMQSQ